MAGLAPFARDGGSLGAAKSARMGIPNQRGSKSEETAFVLFANLTLQIRFRPQADLPSTKHAIQNAPGLRGQSNWKPIGIFATSQDASVAL
jgi:hypothetical protein